MEITIIGAGNMASGIATRALAGGHSVRLADRDQAKAKALAEDLRERVPGADVREVAGELAGVVVLALPFAAEEVAAAAPGARVVKAFNTTFAGTLVAGQAGGAPLDVFIARPRA